MKIKFVLSAFFLLLAAAAVWILLHQTVLLEKTLNLAGHEYFENSIRLNRVEFDRKLRLHLWGVQGRLKTSEAPYVIEVRSLESTNSLLRLIQKQPLFFLFDGVRLHGSAFKGIKGRGRAGLDGSFLLESEIEGIGLEDLAPLNPENLKGASGEVHGSILLETQPGREPVFAAEVHGGNTGGKVPSRFFAALLPYLPPVQNRKELEAIIRIAGLVTYSEADFKLRSAGPGHVKVFLHMRIPDYNFNLNLNVEIRVDEQNFFQAFSNWMGAETK